MLPQQSWALYQQKYVAHFETWKSGQDGGNIECKWVKLER